MGKESANVSVSNGQPAVFTVTAIGAAPLAYQWLFNGAPLDASSGSTLLQRLEFHSVKEIAIPADPPLAEMFELLRALADQPGDDDISTRLRANGAR